MRKELYAADLKVNGLTEPLGVSCEDTCFGWKIKGIGCGVVQRQFRIQVAADRSFCSEAMIADITEDSSRQYYYLQQALPEKTKFYWRLMLVLSYENCEEHNIGWSKCAVFETALENHYSWKAKWIEADEDFYKEADMLCRKFWKQDAQHRGDDQGLRRNPYMRKLFYVEDGIDYARLYITARGLYEAYLNGGKVGNYAMAPDFTAFNKELYYQTYDITQMLKYGENHLQVILGDGWFVGHAQGIPGTNHLYGERPALLLQAEICYHDGRKQFFVSDEDFEVYSGPLLYADLFIGEYWDYQETEKQFKSIVREYDKSILVPQKGEGVAEIEILPAVSSRKLREGEYIVDFGRIIAGRERIIFENEENRKIKIEYSEMLDEAKDGDLMELISGFPYHDQTNYLMTGNQSHLVFEPRFSFQGFRYIKISGVENGIRKEQCEAVVLETKMRNTISFQCNNPLINQLMENVKRSQQGNMISIPTDCPQRERAGFTGDAQIFSASAAWNQDVEQFYRRWLEQCRLEQLEKGQIPIVVPYTKAYSENEANPGWTSAGWGDAIIFAAWDIYRAYGDIHILEENYEAMERWMNYVKECAAEMMPERFYFDYHNRCWQKYLWNAGFHWGDWKLPGYTDEEGAQFTKEITGSLFYYHEACTMEQICQELKYHEQTKVYKDLKERIKTAFYMVYVSEDMRIVKEFQGAYVLALHFGIAEGREAEAFAARLNEMVKQSGYHLQTGFLSTPYLLDVLCRYGWKDTAAQVFYQESSPSWIYQVKHGATTIWEDWDGDLLLENGKTKGSSFNHYAFGCICDFVYRKIAGVSIEEAGFKRIRIAPEFLQGINMVELAYETPYGLLQVKWNQSEKGTEVKIMVPHNTSAIIGEGKDVAVLGSGEHTLLYTPFGHAQ
ncbi:MULTISPECIES: family 78 glycoside hydrolase catalytic domain [Blautia]|uniref:family 78 glycoside hydrolase catalytic domain n=1 Tax=Blautia TaxID=572511 RepID=UPI000BA42778|nr:MULTISPECIES: family 78 glycoside hydrolase catalytic domain [Blautia]